MIDHTEDSSLHIVKYKNVKNEMEDESTTEILIPPVHMENTRSKSKRRRTKLLNSYFKKHVIILMLVLTILMGCCVVYFYKTDFPFGDRDVRIKSNSISEVQTRNGSKVSCLPLKPIKKIIIETVMLPNYTCTDNTTCHSLLDRIEQDLDGLKYNFVISSNNELYIGMGFNCRVSGDESTLHIKMLRSEYSHKDVYGKAFRVTEIIEQGLLCGNIAENYTVLSTDIGETINTRDVTEIFVDLQGGLKPEKLYNLHFPDYEIGTLIHKDFKWIACGDNSTNTKQITKSRVLTLESLPPKSCLRMKPVDKVRVDIVEASHFSCYEISSCVHIFEDQHDGLKYNFIIGNSYDTYVGLGFHCRPVDRDDDELRIKVLQASDHYVSLTSILLKLIQIVGEGIDCGKLLNNFTATVNCTAMKETCNKHVYEEFLLSERDRTYFWGHSTDYFIEENYSDHNASNSRVVPKTMRYKACHKKHKSHTTEISILSSVIPSTETTSPAEFLDYETSKYSQPSTTESNFSTSESYSTPMEPLFNEDEDSEDLQNSTTELESSTTEVTVSSSARQSDYSDDWNDYEYGFGY